MAQVDKCIFHTHPHGHQQFFSLLRFVFPSLIVRFCFFPGLAERIQFKFFSLYLVSEFISLFLAGQQCVIRFTQIFKGVSPALCQAELVIDSLWIKGCPLLAQLLYLIFLSFDGFAGICCLVFGFFLCLFERFGLCPFLLKKGICILGLLQAGKILADLQVGLSRTCKQAVILLVLVYPFLCLGDSVIQVLHLVLPVDDISRKLQEGIMRSLKSILGRLLFTYRLLEVGECLSLGCGGIPICKEHFILQILFTSNDGLQFLYLLPCLFLRTFV